MAGLLDLKDNDTGTDVDNSHNKQIQQQKWEDLFDVGLGVFSVHKIEELLTEVIMLACLWCPEFLNYLFITYNNKKNSRVQDQEVNAAIEALESEEREESEKLAEIRNVVERLVLNMGSLLLLIQNMKVDHSAKQLIITKKMKEHQQPEHPSYEIGENSITHAKNWQRIINLTNRKCNDENKCSLVKLIESINSMRNDIIHHNTRRPCMSLSVKEREHLISLYKWLMASDIVRLAAGDTEQRRMDMSIVQVSDRRAIREECKSMKETIRELERKMEEKAERALTQLIHGIQLELQLYLEKFKTEEERDRRSQLQDEYDAAVEELDDLKWEQGDVREQERMKVGQQISFLEYDIEELETRIEQAEEEIGSKEEELDRKITEHEEELDRVREEHEEELDRVREEHEEELDRVREEHEKELNLIRDLYTHMGV